jgi:hypothetical protein
MLSARLAMRLTCCSARPETVDIAPLSRYLRIMQLPDASVVT